MNFQDFYIEMFDLTNLPFFILMIYILLLYDIMYISNYFVLPFRNESCLTYDLLELFLSSIAIIADYHSLKINV
jgi:hypothetical protein